MAERKHSRENHPHEGSAAPDDEISGNRAAAREPQLGAAAGHVTAEAQSRLTRSARARRIRLIIGSIATLLLGTAAFVVTEWWQRTTHEHATERRVQDIAGALRTGLATPIESLYAVQAFLEVPRVGLSHAQFQAFCRPALERQRSIVALEWFPVVRHEEREAFERWVRKEQPDFQMREPTRSGAMVPAVQRDVHVPLTYSEPLVPQVQGLDIAFDPPRVEPVWRALESGKATLSDRYQLVEDPDGVFSVVAYAPVTRAIWVDDTASAEGAFTKGVAVALFRLNALLETALQAQDLSDIGFELSDPSAPAELQHLYRSGKAIGDRNTAQVPFVDKIYSLTVYSNTPRMSWLPWVVLFASLLAGGSLITSLDARVRARQLERTVKRLGVYQLEGCIASGGMGTVYKAHHALLKRPTAIKIAHDEQKPVNFEKEVLLTSSLTHPNTVLVYDFGQGEDGSFYYAMEYIEGYNLEHLVQVAGPLPPARVIRLLLQIIGSLEEAHQHGLVHRDVKPSNVMVTERGGVRDFVKVLDFGLVKRHNAGRLPSASSGMVSVAFAGTPGYVAPEVIAGAPATPASDIFSLGCVAYFLLAGRAPFSTTSPTEALTLVLTMEPPPLPSNVPAPLEHIVRSCLAKKPLERPATMRALGERLRQALPQCTPWTQNDADRWWAEHPPQHAPEPTKGSLTFFLRQRRTRSSRGSQEGSPG